MKCRKAQYNLGHSVLYGGKAMFSEVNSLIFLLIFLVYFLICVAVCRRKTGLYDCRDAGMELVKGLLFCGVTAMLLAVITIYLWFLVLILMAIVIKHVCCLKENNALTYRNVKRQQSRCFCFCGWLWLVQQACSLCGIWRAKKRTMMRWRFRSRKIQRC